MFKNKNLGWISISCAQENRTEEKKIILQQLYIGSEKTVLYRRSPCFLFLILICEGRNTLVVSLRCCTQKIISFVIRHHAKKKDDLRHTSFLTEYYVEQLLARVWALLDKSTPSLLFNSICVNWTEQNESRKKTRRNLQSVLLL